MNFIADRQTLEDLNLLGKYKQHSIFSLFNNVKTAGGEQLLSEMFQGPLSDPDAINNRSGTLKRFQQEQIVFPFTNKEFAIVEDYLNGTSAGNYLGTLLTLVGKKFLTIVVRDEEYPNIQRGLQQTITLLNDCKNFIGEIEAKMKGSGFSSELFKAKVILSDPLLPKPRKDGVVESSLFQMAKDDHYLRHSIKADLLMVVGILYQLDVYIAVARLAEEMNFSYALALPKDHHVLNATELKHPNINKAIGNSVFFNQESNMIFLTGANMAGKSTFMKSLGIAMYLAHMGFPVAAQEMQFSVKDGIYSSINVPDNLDMGYSHFYAEVLRVKRVAEAVGEKKDLIVIFDELFKGTNVKDAYEATLAVTAAFSVYRNCLFIISTHIIEAGEALKAQNPNIQMLYLPTILNGNIPSYTYQLSPGISGDRHGMMIIKNEGILEMLQ